MYDPAEAIKPRVVMEIDMIKSLIKSMAIYAAVGTVLLGSGKMLATGINAMIDSANQMNDAVSYCVTAIVDTDDVK